MHDDSTPAPGDRVTVGTHAPPRAGRPHEQSIARRMLKHPTHFVLFTLGCQGLVVAGPNDDEYGDAFLLIAFTHDCSLGWVFASTVRKV